MAIETYCDQIINANLTLGSANSFGKLIFDTGGFDVGEIEVGSYQAMYVDAQDGLFELMSGTSNQNHVITGTMGGYVALNFDGTTKLETKDYGVLISGELNISTINNVSTDTDKFLVSDSGVIKYRTGAEVRTDIGAIGPANNQASQNPISGYIPVFVSGTTTSEPGTISNSILSQTTPYLTYSSVVNTGVLDIRGTLKQSFTKESIYIGDNVGSSINTVSGFQDIYNIGIGNDVLKNYITGQDGGGAQESPGDNVGIGYQAITNLTYGTNNVAIGTYTGKALTLGANNVALGKNSLLALTGTRSNSLGNIALGFNALSSATTGTFNVAIGNTNLQSTTSAGSVVSIGNDVAKQFTGTITNAVLIGSKVLSTSQATNINDAIVIGQNGGLLTTGTLTNDILIGKNCFNSNTSGGNNIAIGGTANQQNGTVSTSIAVSTRDGVGTGGKASSFGIVISTYDDADTGVGGVNDSQGKYSAIIGGIGNLNQGARSFIGGGHNNTIGSSGLCAIVGGQFHETQGARGFIGGGWGNTIASGAANSAILGGSENDVSSSAGIALGSGLAVDGENQVVVGRYNTGNNNSKFIVGAGFTTANRINAFEVKNTSQLKLGKYGGTQFTQSGSSYNFLTVGGNGNVNEVPWIDINPQNLVASNYTVNPTGVVNLPTDFSTRLVKISWGSGGNGTAIVRLPIASNYTNKTIQIITDGTFDVGGGKKVQVEPSFGSGDTIDGSGTFELSKKYEGVTLWSDGTEWFVIQAKAH